MERVVVVGNGMVGYKFCEKFVAQKGTDRFQLVVFGEEPRPAYDRVHLSAYFEGKSAEDLTMAPAGWYQEQGIELLCGERIVDIDRSAKEVVSDQGRRLKYDKLVLATGSVPFVPPIPGVEKEGVLVYRTIEDLEAIKAYGEKVRSQGNGKAAVLGGGLLGLEAAKAVRDLGLETHVVEFAPRLMPRQLDDAGAGLLKRMIESMQIGIHTNKATTEITGNGKMEGMTFKDGDSLDVEMLVISAGIRPRDELARHTALEVGPRGGITVNERMQTSDPEIYAIGESALYQGMIYGLVAPGYEMAEVAVSDILGGSTTMSDAVDMSTKLKLIGVDVASFGDPMPNNSQIRTIAYEDALNQTYKRINVSEDGKQLLGGILVGDADDYNFLLQMVQNAMPLPPEPADLILGPRGGGEAAAGSVMDFPDEAVICSCEQVTKLGICEAITSGTAENLKGVSACTGATTGCGGCKPMVADLVKATLESMGQVVKEEICEHFPYNRRELYDLIKIQGIKTYDEALDAFGSGDGCEVCKPVLASVFAGIYNETAVVQETIQDTNDRYLANIQRNGTYSVVPRVPGGEITPEKLMVIGQVAQKYDLYTKITGGQRIDLFGARVDQLPDIWEELIEAGFESGHAYGKALRTVKSCVGSTWCRYGMDESVSFAIELEERYKGIRSPHKLKGGVSGCIRECAEARCKDFGVIATEKGWNLYVCGNGGANPKHAKLLAEDLDRETCTRYLDRFLIYYLRTAAPLMRTAAWLEKLDGGFEYLKQVVVEDSLGLGETMETEMRQMVNTYKCEWREVVENPELRKRFRHFVNSEDADDNLEYVPMREQKMPAPWA
ncbi:nitrite reductase large subunit NirB [Pontibacter sp. G13]|uniref:nitrite reductase large subunit NirB n=1 Tax=Pontibacter sp. G13 TaxID=3074898 RepID=UPI00288BA015|nr:nitrite reductase large subunit NirB [Pontibacter sp. G13]WNJ17839.1 nitrite reductase large subunit NirB [Pontibacter sp. G13]